MGKEHEATLVPRCQQEGGLAKVCLGGPVLVLRLS